VRKPPAGVLPSKGEAVPYCAAQGVRVSFSLLKKTKIFLFLKKKKQKDFYFFAKLEWICHSTERRRLFVTGIQTLQTGF
jgi:hypothetical protein